MNNPFDDVPLNTQRAYVKAKATNGCEIYMPVDSQDDRDLISQKNHLQSWLNNHQFPLQAPALA